MNKNNPFNIRWSPITKWIGQSIFHKNGFCEFDDLESGMRAYWIVMRTYVNKHHLFTIEDIINRYAPSTENPTDTYIDFCYQFVFGSQPMFPISLTVQDFRHLGLAMYSFESGKVLFRGSYEREVFEKTFKKYFLPYVK